MILTGSLLCTGHIILNSYKKFFINSCDLQTQSVTHHATQLSISNFVASDERNVKNAGLVIAVKTLVMKRSLRPDPEAKKLRMLFLDKECGISNDISKEVSLVISTSA